MNTGPVTVVAVLQAKSGEENSMRTILAGLVAPTRAEAGCINYDLHESKERPGRFLFHENWTSEADLERHLQSAHVTLALAKVGPLLSETPQITRWTRVA